MNTNEFIEIEIGSGTPMIVRKNDIRDIQTITYSDDLPTYKIKLDQFPFPFPITAECYERLRKMLLRDE